MNLSETQIELYVQQYLESQKLEKTEYDIQRSIIQSCPVGMVSVNVRFHPLISDNIAQEELDEKSFLLVLKQDGTVDEKLPWRDETELQKEIELTKNQDQQVDSDLQHISSQPLPSTTQSTMDDLTKMSDDELDRYLMNKLKIPDSSQDINSTSSDLQLAEEIDRQLSDLQHQFSSLSDEVKKAKK
ncbi:hypothetical protein BLNAU_3582 [Blattamonas nauphoetae]|uniref:Uncharacterized protein n=1 Tax=Blattamonas nauphoetae TaxID=2049346 RepID=A0ABQ9YCR4_9EUKA|nr:hypothetical protein BLNAU_3582 [Blattamonas nauphoetae]